MLGNTLHRQILTHIQQFGESSKKYYEPTSGGHLQNVGDGFNFTEVKKSGDVGASALLEF